MRSVRSAALALDRRLAREWLRPVPVVLMVAAAAVLVLSWTSGLEGLVGPRPALFLGWLAPAVFGAAAWLRVGRSTVAALSWSIAFLALTVGAAFASEPFRLILLGLAAGFWLSMLFVSRAINWWEAKLLGTVRYGRLDREEQAFDRAVDGALDHVLANGSQFERGRISSVELGRRHGQVLAQVLSLKAPRKEWDDVRRHLIDFLSAVTAETEAEPRSAAREDARQEAEHHLRAYQDSRTRLRAARLRPWKGLELLS